MELSYLQGQKRYVLCGFVVVIVGGFSSSFFLVFHGALRPQKPSGLLETGKGKGGGGGGIGRRDRDHCFKGTIGAFLAQTQKRFFFYIFFSPSFSLRLL